MYKSVAVLAVLVWVMPAWGQAQQPVPEHVLDRVPAGSVGFVVIENAGQVGAVADTFLASVSPPDEPILPVSIIELIMAQFGIAEGLNPSGGFAAVLLDPKPYALELAEILAGERKDGSKITSDALPLVALIPGKDPAAMFAFHKPTVVDGVVQFTGKDKKPRYCLQAGGYVAMGPNLKAVRAVATGDNPIRQKLPAADMAFIKAHHLTVWVDMTQLAPALAKRARGDASVKAGGGMIAAIAALKGDPMAQWGPVLEQMATGVVGLRFDKKGLFIDARGTFRPGSAMARALTGYKPAPAKLLAPLPGPPYVLALGLLNAPKTPQKLLAERIDRLLAGPAYRDLPPEAHAVYRMSALSLADQIKSVHVYAGPMSSKLRLVYVIRCTSAAKARTQLDDIVTIAGQAAATGADERLKGVKLTYEPKAAKVAGREADVMTMSSTATTDAQRKRARTLLGADSFRLLVVQANAETLVIAMDGDEKAIAQAVAAAAAESGKLPADPGVAKALSLLPANRTAEGVVNLRQLQPIIRALRVATGKKPVHVPIDSDVPFAGSAQIIGSSVQVTVVMPTETIQAAMKVVSALLDTEAE